MKRRMVSLLLALILLAAALPVTVFAGSEHRLAAGNIRLSNDTYYPNGSLKTITTTFDWGYFSNSVSGARLILMSERLGGSEKTGDSLYSSDFSDVGKYRNSFDNYAQAKSFDNANGTFGIISCNSSDTNIAQNSQNNTISMTIDQGDIPMNVDGIYYIYLWVTYQGNFYPDNLICAIQVKNGELQYSPGDASTGLRNYYNPAAFREVGSFLVEVVPGAGMSLTSGTESQSVVAGSAITNVVYTANSGYSFPANYSVAGKNGITVTRLSDSQIQVSGTPTADTKITLAAAQITAPAHDCIPSGWLYDDNNHWKRSCSDMNCPENKYTVPTNRGAHTFTNALDTDCNDGCGYTRTAPAEKPETGDITHIPMWTALFLGGLALLWVQLEQRKRQQY